MVRDGRILLIDVAFAELRPTPWRQAVDLANMMLCLALRSSAQQVYDRALRQFTVEEITEAFAAARGLALPSQLRRALRARGTRPPRRVPPPATRTPPAHQGAAMDAPARRRRRSSRPSSSSCSCSISPGCSSATTTPTPRYTSTPSATRWSRCGCRRKPCPTAQLVPCVASLPVGWSFRSLTVNNGRSTITLDHDRAGSKAIDLRFAEYV